MTKRKAYGITSLLTVVMLVSLVLIMQKWSAPATAATIPQADGAVAVAQLAVDAPLRSLAG